MNSKCMIMGLLVIFLQSCSFFDNTDQTPMFLQLGEATLETDFNEGANTHDIRDAYIFADGILIGVFELPATVPVLDDDDSTMIEIFAGIRSNGINSNPIQYPFYEKISLEVDFNEGTFLPIELNFRYVEAAVFELIEDFENPHVFNADIDMDTVTVCTLDNTMAAPGGGQSGLMSVDSLHPVIEISTQQAFDPIPFLGSAVFVELDYKNDIPFSIGTISVADNIETLSYKLVLRASEGEWKKVYVNFTNDLGISNIVFYRIVLGAIYDAGESSNVNIDNIKLIRF